MHRSPATGLTLFPWKRVIDNVAFGLKMMKTLLLDIWSRIGTTVLFVTHDIDEALFLGDRILMLSPRPARIVADIRVPLARPRTDDSTIEPAFVDIKRRCLALLRDAA